MCERPPPRNNRGVIAQTYHDWRGWTLHLPRTNLGGEYTRSLTDSSDAVPAVESMYNTALNRGPFSRIAETRSPGSGHRLRPQHCAKTGRFNAESAPASVTGQITKRRFEAVQNRTGVFAEPCPFSPPSKRDVLDPTF